MELKLNSFQLPLSADVWAASVDQLLNSAVPLGTLYESLSDHGKCAMFKLMAWKLIWIGDAQYVHGMLSAWTFTPPVKAVKWDGFSQNLDFRCLGHEWLPSHLPELMNKFANLLGLYFTELGQELEEFVRHVEYWSNMYFSKARGTTTPKKFNSR